MPHETYPGYDGLPSVAGQSLLRWEPTGCVEITLHCHHKRILTIFDPTAPPNFLSDIPLLRQSKTLSSCFTLTARRFLIDYLILVFQRYFVFRDRDRTRKLFSINFKGISKETSFLIFYSSQGMYIESTRKSRFPELGGKSDQHQLRMS